jgi:hypothetical protein
MECRSGCGACCIAPAITRPYYGMPAGKPAGVRCVHLDDALRCGLFGRPERPRCCSLFRPEPAFCGDSREEALVILEQLEAEGRPA